MNDAIEEFSDYDRLVKANKNPTPFTGPLQCFCKKESKKHVRSDKEYELKEDGQVIFKAPICYEIWYDKVYSKVITVLISMIVVSFNTLLTYFIVFAVKLIGDDSRSVMESRMVKALFIAQFFNTSFIVLLANANLKEHEPKFITERF